MTVIIRTATRRRWRDNPELYVWPELDAGTNTDCVKYRGGSTPGGKKTATGLRVPSLLNNSRIVKLSSVDRIFYSHSSSKDMQLTFLLSSNASHQV